MSIISRPDLEDELSDTSLEDLLSALGAGDTPHLFSLPYKIDTTRDIPFGAGNSVDRKTKYIDRLLYQELMDGEFAASGLLPDQILAVWCDHEHSEITIVQGDNPVFTQKPAHRRALCLEHHGVLTVLGRDDGIAKLKRYEATIWPGLVRCYKRPVKNPPLDLWCAPLIDEPEDQDEEHIKRLQSLGVLDAFKRSKLDAHYGIGPDQCHECEFSTPPRYEHNTISTCQVMNGLIRHNRWCAFFKPKDSAQTAA